MNYLLDTNACIVYLNNIDSLIRKKMEKHTLEHVFICSIVKAELLYGAFKSQRVQHNLKKLELFFSGLKSFNFDDLAAQHFGEVRVNLQKRGTPIGAYDMQIAAVALANNLTLVTHNTKEFSRVKGLKLEDWEV